MAAETLVRLNGVSKSYSLDGLQPSTPVLDQLDFEVKTGESVAIVGPSGSGKSTLLNLIGALDTPTTGSVWVAGQELSGLSEPELAAFRNREIGFVFQDHHLLPPCSVLENVLLPTLVLKEPVSDEPPIDRARRLLVLMGLEQRLEHLPSQLSGGERQRVAVVRALINQPKLLLADEPTGSLDHASADRLARLLGELNRMEKVTLLMVTHAMDLAHRLERVVELRDGKLTEVREQPA